MCALRGAAWPSLGSLGLSDSAWAAEPRATNDEWCGLVPEGWGRFKVLRSKHFRDHGWSPSVTKTRSKASEFVFIPLMVTAVLFSKHAFFFFFYKQP